MVPELRQAQSEPRLGSTKRMWKGKKGNCRRGLGMTPRATTQVPATTVYIYGPEDRQLLGPKED